MQPQRRKQTAEPVCCYGRLWWEVGGGMMIRPCPPTPTHSPPPAWQWVCATQMMLLLPTSTEASRKTQYFLQLIHAAPCLTCRFFEASFKAPTLPRPCTGNLIIYSSSYGAQRDSQDFRRKAVERGEKRWQLCPFTAVGLFEGFQVITGKFARKVQSCPHCRSCSYHTVYFWGSSKRGTGNVLWNTGEKKKTTK